MVHDEAKDKEFRLEISWIGPQSKNQHCHVPQAVLEAAEAEARAALDDGMDED